jgi:hypothetical protein
VEAVGDAVVATPLQLLSWFKQSVPENAEPARPAQELNWWVQAAEAADGRSTKTSSRTRNSPTLPVTPGMVPPRLRTKTKKETTSTRTVVVLVVEMDVVASAEVVVLVAAVLLVVATMAVGKVVAWVVAAVVLLFAKLVNATVVELARLEVVAVVELTGSIFPSRISCKTVVLMVAAVTIQSTVVWVTGLTFNPKKVWHPKAGTGPKLVAKRLAINVNKLLDAPGAGDVAPLNNASFKAMKIPDAAYLWQYVIAEALAASAAGGWPTPAL